MPIKIHIADTNFLIREGLKSLINKREDMRLVGESADATGLMRAVLLLRPDVLLYDYSSAAFSTKTIPTLLDRCPGMKIMAITDGVQKDAIKEALRLGVFSHVLKECDDLEIQEGISDTANGKKFFCGKVLHALESGESNQTLDLCAGFGLSKREIEIISCVAKGMTNKEAADQLYLSTHTVTTHRKNVMAKLGINNTAALVIYAVKMGIIVPQDFDFVQPEEQLASA